MKKNRISILLADDHSVLRDGLRALLERESDLEVVAEAADGQTAVRLARELRPQVVLMDIGMPDLNGIDATRRIVAHHPQARVLCLSMHREKQLVQAMLEAGAAGYLLKTSAAREIVDAVRTVAGGACYLCPSIAADIIKHVQGAPSSTGVQSHVELSAREREVLQLIAEGHHTKLIADRLNLSPKTVLSHRENIMRKVGVQSIASLTRFALREGIVEL